MKTKTKRLLRGVLLLGVLLHHAKPVHCQDSEAPKMMNDEFLIKKSELILAFKHDEEDRSLSFEKRGNLSADAWKGQCAKKLAELLHVAPPVPCDVTDLRKAEYKGVEVHALVMKINEKLSIPAYLLIPKHSMDPKRAVIAIHGHGEVEPCIGMRDDYHHSFALELAQAGHLVLCPELRGFGTLFDVSCNVQNNRLDYWKWGKSSAYSLVTDGFIHGNTLMGETVEDLLRWENWLALARGIEKIDAAGISYGGDLALIYPVFSQRVERIFASGTLGSFSVIFRECYNAPAHCIPGILRWMDRSDIAGLNAPRPLLIHYGELDKPGPENGSASYNDTVQQSFAELKAIYKAFGAEEAISLKVSPGKRHEMDNGLLLKFFDFSKP